MSELSEEEIIKRLNEIKHEYSTMDGLKIYVASIERYFRFIQTRKRKE